MNKQNRTLLSFSLGVALLTPAALLAATRPVAPQGSQAQATPSAQAPAKPAPKKARPKSKAEAQALNSLRKMSLDAATTGAQMDAAITDFATKYPTSDFLATINIFGLRYYQTQPHVDYDKSLLYGESALKADPDSLYALTTLGRIIPEHVQDTDLDHDQRMKEATADSQHALEVADTAGATLEGQPFTPQARNLTKALAYSSLAAIATKNKDYQGAVNNYKQAVQFDSGYSVASDYFYMARAQMQLKQYPEALASLDASAKAAPDSAAVQQAVASNRAAIKKLQGH